MKVLKALLWVLLVVLIVFLTLYFSAWIAGFASVGDLLEYLLEKVRTGGVFLPPARLYF
ncbi:MAG: hypothetical protein ACK5L3_05200 [Oscillospiraceae bacterium]